MLYLGVEVMTEMTPGGRSVLEGLCRRHVQKPSCSGIWSVPGMWRGTSAEDEAGKMSRSIEAE